MTSTVTHAGLHQRLGEEQQALMALLTGLSDQQWTDVSRDDGWSVHEVVGHLADANYGLALMTLGEIAPAIPVNEQGQLDASGINESGRQRNAALGREKIMERLTKSFGHVARAIDGSADLHADGPYGAASTRGMWLQRIVNHMAEHRRELEAVIGS